jgi:hypothetical protein
MTLADFGSLALAFVTTISLIYVSRQVRVSRLQTKGQFMLALDEQLKPFASITLALANKQVPFTPQSQDWFQVWSYLSVFERMNIMVEDGILDVAMVDRLYGFRLAAILGNDDVFKMVQQAGGEWQDFIHLCKVVAERREQNHVADYDQTFIERAKQLRTDTIVSADQWSAQINISGGNN